MNVEAPLLEVRDLNVSYLNVKVVSDVSFKIFRGKVFALVGESGCGKTTTANAILRILPEIASVDSKSKIIFYKDAHNPYNLLEIDESQFSREIRWREISMVFQGALNSLNPTIRVKDHFIETAKAHGVSDKSWVLERARELLEAVKLDPDRVLSLYPVEMSGGMKQRTLIALALILNPKFVILDEPTTALDVLTQREILFLLRDLKNRFNLTYMLITHDIALVADMADIIAIMYAGRIVEEAKVEDIFYEPLHPYTKGLLMTVPKLGEFKEDIASLPGSPPDYRRLPSGCKFHPRCPYAMDICRREEPKMVDINGRKVLCWLYSEKGEGYE
uniref:ABC transporter ATP-binding protein n=1 Tax=Ignisphaera aggregans TaxID=334771 RepID=A0A7C5XI56_9CREN